MKNIEDSRVGPERYIAQGTRGVLRIIQPSHKYADVSSRTGPIAWCDHGNSTDVKFLRALHSALRARNRTGDKNLKGPVVGCDWGIRQISTTDIWRNYYTTDKAKTCKTDGIKTIFHYRMKSRLYNKKAE